MVLINKIKLNSVKKIPGKMIGVKPNLLFYDL